MKTSMFILVVFLFVSAVAVISNGLRVLGPSGPLSVQPGDSVVLPCYVETPIPTEELEVEWRRTDSETVVHLFQDGESRPEAQAQVYHDRTHFFTEEVTRGNFSLLLTDVTTEDTGVYKCVVYTNQESIQTLIEIKMSEYLVVSGGHVVSVYVGEDTTLNCSVHSHIPPEEIEEVSWKKKKTDEDIVVMQFVNGQIVAESTNERYRDRVELLSSEEIHKGNFSLRLKNVQTEDKGMYVCEAFHEELSANTTVEVQQLGFSTMHIAVLFFCILAFAPCLLGYKACTSLKINDLPVQLTFICCPIIALCIAFILWGVTEGFLAEVATCVALNFFRTLSLLWVASHFQNFPEKCRRFLKHAAVPLGCASITAVIYSVLAVNNWHKYQALQNTADRFIFMIPFAFLATIVIVLYGYSFLHKAFKSIASVCISLIHCNITLLIFLWYGTKSIVNVVLGCASCLLSGIWVFLSKKIQSLHLGLDFVLFSLFSGCDILCVIVMRTQILLLTSLLISELLGTAISIYLPIAILGTDKECVPLALTAAYLHILSMIEFFGFLVHVDGLNSTHNNDTGTQQPPGLFHMIVYLLGSVGLTCINSISLITELILKTLNGERTVTDLRVILLPSECFFAMCCLALQMSTFWRKKGERLKSDINSCHQLCRCTKTAREPSVENNELENLRSFRERRNN